MNSSLSRITTALIMCIAIFSCSENETEEMLGQKALEDKDYKYVAPEVWDLCMDTTFVYDEFNIIILPYNQLPYIEKADSLAPTEWIDDDSIPVRWGGQTQAYHPVYMVQYSFQLLDVFNTTGDSAKLRYVEKIADKLVHFMIPLRGAYFMFYTWDYPIHKIPEEELKAPWYSAMAQGQALSLVCRLYELTGKEKYLEVGHKLFNSFSHYKGYPSNPWVSCIDSNQNIWLEEYPRYQPCFTLNGMIFSMFGVYDYYRITKSEESEKLFKGTLTTIKNNLDKFRIDGDRSYYCLKHKLKVPNFRYQRVHTTQLSLLYKMTGDEYFQEMSDNMKNDIIEPEAEFFKQQIELKKKLEEAKKKEEESQK